MSEPSEQQPDTIDYNRVYADLQEKYHLAYSRSQKLFVTEKAQRKTLYHYKRRINAILDLLADSENETLPDPGIDADRISAVIQKEPALEKHLSLVLKIAAGEDEKTIPLKPSSLIDLAVNEMIPELTNDELDTVEMNPQDTDMWTRRNFSNLVISKFRPAVVNAKGVRDYYEESTNKRRRRAKDPA